MAFFKKNVLQNLAERYLTKKSLFCFWHFLFLSGSSILECEGFQTLGQKFFCGGNILVLQEARQIRTAFNQTYFSDEKNKK